MSLTRYLDGVERAFEPFREILSPILSNPTLLALWGLVVGISVGVLWRDIRARNRALPSMMKGVWTLVVLYSGPFGLAVYWFAGRTQISHDSLWRRGLRSTAHCYSGCGGGEVVGVLLAQAILGLATGWVAAITFGFAYLFGYALTVGPLMQEGVAFWQSMKDALYSETPSITVMELVAITTDLLLASQTRVTDILFWTSLIFSLSLGFLAAFPVNVTLVKFGVKEGMKNPAEMGENRSNSAQSQATG
jgi:hypothetical protein